MSASALISKAKSQMSRPNFFFLSSAKQRGHIQTALRKYCSLNHAQMSPGRKMVGTGQTLGAHQHFHGEGSHGSVLKPLSWPGFIWQYGCKVANREHWFLGRRQDCRHCNHSELVHMFKGLLTNILRFYDMYFSVLWKSSLKVQIGTISWFQNDADIMPKHAITKKAKPLIFRTTEGFELLLLVLG